MTPAGGVHPPGPRLRVAVSGAAGRMGRAAVRAIAAQPDLVLVAALGHADGLEKDVGTVAGIAPLDVRMTNQLDEVVRARPDVLVDFAPGAQAMVTAQRVVTAGISPVIGSTGMSRSAIEELTKLCEARGVGGVLAPNFALGAVLMMEFARQAARYFPNVEIIERHHDRKRDAPSGTALLTAERIAQARGESSVPAVKEEETVPGARGGRRNGVAVHSLRLPGSVAHQEVIFGGPGQTLTIRHDSMNEESFMPGLLIAIRRVRSLPGLVVGLENLLTP